MKRMRPTFVVTLVKCDIVLLNKGKMVEVYEGELSAIYYGLCKQSCADKPVSWLQHHSWNRSFPRVVQIDQEML